MVSSPFCSGDRSNKSFQAHPWLPSDRKLKAFFCPVCDARGEI